MQIATERDAALSPLLSPPAPVGFARVVGSSEAIGELLAYARTLSKADSPVLLQGESGVGKELLARAIHEESARRDKPFVSVQCSGLTPELLARELFGFHHGVLLGARSGGVAGKIAAANGGTLFLDDIDQMPLELAPFFLRVLESGELYPLGGTEAHPVEFRVICACSGELFDLVRAGRFRMDLYYRLAWSALSLPPLRERSEDVPLLVEYFTSQTAGAQAKRFTPAVQDAFLRYRWPGNVRELRNVVESMLLLNADDTIDVGALPSDLAGALERASVLPGLADDATFGLERVERDAIGECLRMHGGNLTRTARELRIARSTLYAKLKKYGLETSLDTLRFSGQKRAPADIHGES